MDEYWWREKKKAGALTPRDPSLLSMQRLGLAEQKILNAENDRGMERKDIGFFPEPSVPAHVAQGSIHFFASELQRILDVRVDAVHFSGPFEGTPNLTSPCSVVALRPFVAGGERRLLLNVEADLVRLAADAFCSGGAAAAAAAIDIGKLMLLTGSLPNHDIDTEAAIRWNCVLNCGPLRAFCCPVPFEVTSEGRTAILRGRRTIDLVERENGSSSTEETAADRWLQRDLALQSEFNAVLHRAGFALSRVFGPIGRLFGAAADWAPTLGIGRLLVAEQPSNSTSPWQPTELVTYSPILPVLLGALVPGGVGSLEGATAALVRTDRMFALSLFWGTTLMDRTGVLEGPIRTAALDPIPTREEVLSSATTSLADHCMATAANIWTFAHRGGSAETGRPLQVQVMWSGGIDSTAVLCALMRTASDAQRARLIVRCDENSIQEYPLFYKEFILGSAGGGPYAVEPMTDLSVSREAARCRFRLTVTGELGDQIFGSARMRGAFQPPWNSRHPVSGEPSTNYFAAGLDAPWEDTVLPALAARGLLCGTGAEWVAWIRPQLAASPVAIVTTFDFLWWLNFSCSWQHVALRITHSAVDTAGEEDAGLALPVQNVVHFFQSAGFQRWSCLPANHAAKFGNRKEWSTYKEPLKAFIRDWTGDSEYYATKEKVGSLNRPEENGGCGAMMGLARDGHVLSWGKHSIMPRAMRRKYGDKLFDLLTPSARRACAGACWESTWEPVPWREATLYPWASAVDPGAAAVAALRDDERGDRPYEPVTRVSLEVRLARARGGAWPCSPPPKHTRWALATTVQASRPPPRRPRLWSSSRAPGRGVVHPLPLGAHRWR